MTDDEPAPPVEAIVINASKKKGVKKDLLPPKETRIKLALHFLGYFFNYLYGSFLLLIIGAVTIIYLEHQNSRLNRIQIKAAAASTTKQELRRKIEEIPSWVKFPDRERAEWLNQVIAQFWPTLQNYVIKIFRTKIQNNLRKKYESFRFEDINLGCNPPKIDGIKVYQGQCTKDAIIIDFDVFYDGNCDINFSVSGAQMGGIRDFQLSVEVRVILKPLLLKMPLIGGIQIFFLNTPDICFTLDGLSGIPGLSYFLRTKIEEKLMKWIVYPNTFTKRFSKSVEPSELKALEPSGVLRVHVIEAKDLMAKDITGKSDPYVILKLGAQENKTHYIDQSLNPKWDYWCEFIILDPKAQHLSFQLYDHDKVNEDDFLGSGDIDVDTIISGDIDQWIQLEHATRGSIHLRFTWLSLTPDLSDLEAITTETKLLKVADLSTATLSIFVDSAFNLPMIKPSVKPHPFFFVMVGNKKIKSKIKKHTTDPVWEQGFVFLVPSPRNDNVSMSIWDKQSGSLLTQFTYSIGELLDKENMEISKKEFDLTNNGKIILSMQLRILTSVMTLFDEDETDSDSDINFSRQSSQRASSRSSHRQSSKNELIEEKIVSSKVNLEDASPKKTIKRTISNTSELSIGKHSLGKIELTIAYSEPRQKLSVTVHKATNLPLKDITDIPDPYVKVMLNSNSNGNSMKNKTKFKTDNTNPIYDETFEYLLSKSEVYDHTLSVAVKSKKLFNNYTLGRVDVNLKYVDLSQPYHVWLDLEPK